MKNEDIDKSVQAAIDKLASDEWFAGNIYKLFAIAVKNEDRAKIADEMLDIANDELDDHLKSIVTFALQNGFAVPTAYNEMKKFADYADVKLFETCKKQQDALFYIEQGIESEKRAIEAYEKYVNDYEFAYQFQDFKLILQNNYYDEIDHLKKLEFMKYTLEAAQQLA